MSPLAIRCSATMFCACAVILMTSPAAAKQGDLDLKIFATLVTTDGKIGSIEKDALNLPAGSQSKANNNLTPTIALQYFATDHISIETIAGLSQHDVDGRGALAGTELVADVKVLPTTLTVKYHFGKDGSIRPYLGAGPSYFIFIDEKSGSTTKAMGANRVKIGDKLGFALQAGVDLPLNSKNLFASLDAKRYFMRPTASWSVDGAEVLKTRQHLDPWLISAGFGFRF
jgi:outer membrane protein